MIKKQKEGSGCMMKQKKRQVICIEYPQSLIKSSTVISGANIISQYILKQWLVQTEYQCIFVTDASDVECQEMQAKLVKIIMCFVIISD